jgi:hypothetical protein
VDPPFDWPRGLRSDFVLSNDPGLYALFLCDKTSLDGIVPGREGLLYIGKADGSGGLQRRCHFAGRTINHSPRKSIAVLLMQQLGLVAISNSGGKWSLDDESDRRLSNWMHRHLYVAIRVCSNPGRLESELVAKHSPPLNLTICEQSSQHRFISSERSRIRRGLEHRNDARPRQGIAAASSRFRRPFVEQELVTVNAIADGLGISQKSLRTSLRRGIAWYRKPQSWTFPRGSKEYRDVLEVAKRLANGKVG